ncbi:hypothetical protein DXG03_005748 [Asterophora parasitica]|uniref:ER membrane protein complex subunit 1 n=1 Tax=Asterophora parasitica TaxID=117018 RepID=A0A9P7G5J0_9AGAR|nr:hypothetical protein DXG03_005748 [Asterophora parasitica]
MCGLICFWDLCKLTAILDVATLSGPGGATFRLFNATSGTIHAEKRLHVPESGHFDGPPHLGNHVAFGSESGDIFVLNDGHVVRRLDGKGDVQWMWTAEDQTALTVYTHILPTPSALYLVGVTKSIRSFTLHVTAFDPSTGAVLHTHAVPSSVNDLDAYLFLSQPTQESIPHLAWLEDGELKSFKLTPKLDTKPSAVALNLKTGSALLYERFLDVGLARSGHAVAVAADGSATLLTLKEGKLEGVGAFLAEEKAEASENTDPIWVGGAGQKDGEVVLGRVYWSHAVNKAKAETLTFAPTGETSNSALEIDFDTRSHGFIAHAALSPSQAGSSPSLLLTTSTGAIQLWDVSSTPEEKWTREESLASVVLAEFVELPEGRLDATSARRDGEGFVGRLWRHAGDAQNFPQYLIGFVRRFLTGSYASPTSAPAPASVTSDKSFDTSLIRDAFGFRQVIVAATAQGKIYGIDSSSGRVVWSRILGKAAETGTTVLPVKLFVLGAEDLAGEGEEAEGRAPEVVLVAQRHSQNSRIDTVIFHINALTGADASRDDSELRLGEDPSGLLQGIDIIYGPAVEAFLLSPPPASPSASSSSSENYAKAVLLLDEHLQVHIYPSTPRTRATLRALHHSLHFPLRTTTPSGTRVVGHALGPHPGANKEEENEGAPAYVAHPTWSLGLPQDEDIKTLIPPIRGPVASLGKVLGNRTTLYKYLNPRLFVLLTAPGAVVEENGQTCGLYVVDATKGSIVYRTALPALAGNARDAQCDVKASLAENWLVYHYYDPEWTGEGLTKGWRMVTVELYEGTRLDQKTKSSDISSYSDGSVDVTAFEQSYVFPHAITAIAPTSTKFGMAVKDLIVANRNHQIHSIQRHLLNPRRPNRKVTAEEQEEFLVPYDPVIAYDPRRVLSHNYEVANIQRIITAPALLESTSLVFAYGLDMFLTRVAPSNTFDVLSENFNKAQLVLTVAGG